MKTKLKNSRTDKIFYVINWSILILVLTVVLYPLLFVVKASFSHGISVMSNASLIPEKFSVAGYKAAFEYKRIWSGYRNSLYYMAVGTILNLIVTICAAYPLSRNDLYGRNLFMAIFIFTMYFTGGLVPKFLLVRNLNLLDTLWSMVLPTAMSVYNMIVMRTYFKTQIPKELHEASEIDGCGNMRFLVSVVLPLSTPIMAVIGLFYAISHWNSYFNALLYISSAEKYPLQIVLREILVLNEAMRVSNTDLDIQDIALMEQRANLMKYSLIIIASLPVMMIYPFVQKYFVKGVMLGAIKG